MSFGRFLKNFFLHPIQVGAVAPTGAAYSEMACAQVNWQISQNIAELGAGDGAVTRHIAAHLRPEQKLLVFELNPDLFSALQKNIAEQKNIILINDSAEKLEEYMKKNSITSFDAIFSEVPLVSLPQTIGQNILQAVKNCLSNEGKFLQISYSKFILKKLKNLFTDVQVKFTFWNFPPAFLYICHKS